jgi:predicted ferric reductase
MMFTPLSRIVLYPLIVIFPVVLATALGAATHGYFSELGRNAALTAVMIILLQGILAGRFKWIVHPFGLDIVLRFHKYMAMAAAVLLLLHPVLLAAGSGNLGLLISLDLPWYIWLGKITLLLVLVNVGVSWYQRNLHLKFEKWRFLHDVLGPVIIVFAFVHSITVGHDLQHPLMQVLWVVFFVTAVLVFVWHRMIRPRQLQQHLWEVMDVQPETDDVWTVTLKPPAGKKVFEYLPGQFQFITFFRGRQLPVEEHHWTISSSPAEKNFVTSTIKALGDFTATIKQTRPGDTAAVHAAFGRFTYTLHPEEKDLVFLAGGIGITPLMSMLRHMRDVQADHSVVLLYGNPNTEQAVFHPEIMEIEAGAHPQLKVVDVLSDPDENWDGEIGYIDKEKIIRHCGENLSGKTFYVCGPPPLVAAVISALDELAVSHRQVRVEIFSFLD